jgi:hypothetical protein
MSGLGPSAAQGSAQAVHGSASNPLQLEQFVAQVLAGEARQPGSITSEQASVVAQCLQLIRDREAAVAEQRKLELDRQAEQRKLDLDRQAEQRKLDLDRQAEQRKLDLEQRKLELDRQAEQRKLDHEAEQRRLDREHEMSMSGVYTSRFHDVSLPP